MRKQRFGDTLQRTSGIVRAGISIWMREGKVVLARLKLPGFKSSKLNKSKSAMSNFYYLEINWFI